MRIFLLVISVFISTSILFSQALTVTNLTCENSINPSGVEHLLPTFSWELQSNQHNVLQTAYRVIIADNIEKLNSANIWDTKKVSSSSSIQVTYAGKKLSPVKTYYWKVMVWDNKNNVSAWSSVAKFQMGLLTTNDWKNAQWIAFEKLADSNVNILPTDGKKDKYTGKNILPLLRKSFTTNKSVKCATMFISGLGHFELSLNGKKISDHFLDPGWTKYDKQALYVTFDLTKEVNRGENAIGVMLGNGFYYVPPVSGRYRKLKSAFGFPKMICRLAIEYSDGTSENIVSDRSWRTSAGPITFSSIYGGEDYDATREQNGWDEPGFDDRSWKQVLTVNGPPVLNAQMAEPLKVMDSFSAKKVTVVQDKWVYDLGQNASGIPQIKVQGKKGDTVRIYPAELLKDGGTANQQSAGGPYYLEYILKGGGVESWQPRFTYYGFRYLQVNGIVPKNNINPDNLPVLVDVRGLHTRNAARKTGTFESSNQLFNQTFTLIDWAVKSNMASVLTDCPHREKLGWLEEAHLMGNSVRFNYDIDNLSGKQFMDMIYSQTEEGLIPEIAPEYVKFEWGGDMFRDSPEWGSTGIILPWYVYQWYGNKQVLAETYPMMKRYVDYLDKKSKNHILSQGLGDWYDIGPKAPGVSQLTPMGVTGTAIYYYDLGIISKIARLLGKPADALKFEKLAGDVKTAFNNTFFNEKTKQYGTGSQSANAMAVYMKLVEPRFKKDVVDNIVRDIRDRNNSLTAGDIGYRYLLRVLHEEGRSDVIFDMNSRSDVPGYGYQLAKGATALTESWQAYPANSNNHFMLGHIMEWFFCGLAGINQADNSVAYKNIVIKPEVVGDLTYVRGSYHSMYGEIVSEWKKTAGSFQLAVKIPANTRAAIYLPGADADKVFESGVLMAGKLENGRVLIEVGSGSYSFEVRGN